jgi:lipoate-protein ligase A
MIIHSTPEKALQYEASLVARLSDPAISNTLAFWTTDQCLVAPVSLTKRKGYAQACARLHEIGWPVVVRKTGGGITPQGHGILNVALAYALDPIESPTINGVYEMFCSPLIKLLTQ